MKHLTPCNNCSPIHDHCEFLKDSNTKQVYIDNSPFEHARITAKASPTDMSLTLVNKAVLVETESLIIERPDMQLTGCINQS